MTDTEIIADIKVVTKDGKEYDGKVAVCWPLTTPILPNAEWVLMSRNHYNTHTAIRVTEIVSIEITNPHGDDVSDKTVVE